MEYDVMIIGGGSGGLVVASSTAQLGLKVLLVEKERLGGDCLWYGCVPSKALIAVGKRMHAVRNTEAFGLPDVEDPKIDFGKIMRHMRDVQGTIEPHDSPERFRKLGCTVEFGNPTFIDAHTIFLNEKKITFKYAVIATGSSPRVPKIPGLKEAGYLTNIDVFKLKELPKRLMIIGGGPIGTEMAQVFRRFGSKVTMVVRSCLLPKEDRDLVDKLREVLEKEGVKFLFGEAPTKIEMKKKSKIVTLQDSDGKQRKIGCDEVMLIATGRVPNVKGLELEQAGVAYTKKGITVDSSLRTSKRNIFAIGDVIGQHQFTHMAASHASTVVRNMITPVIKSSVDTVVPWVTFTDPELAHVGMTAQHAKNEGIPCKHYIFPFDANDRAIAEGETVGEIRVVATKRGKILGASILGPNAGELIMEYVLAMKHGLTMKDIASTIHPYPTLAGANQSAAALYYKQLLTEKSKQIAQFLVRKV